MQAICRNRQPSHAEDAATGEDTVKLYAVSLETGAVREIEPRVPVPLANGAIRYKAGRIALLAQVIFYIRYVLQLKALMPKWQIGKTSTFLVRY